MQLTDDVHPPGICVCTTEHVMKIWRQWHEAEAAILDITSYKPTGATRKHWFSLQTHRLLIFGMRDRLLSGKAELSTNDIPPLPSPVLQVVLTVPRSSSKASAVLDRSKFLEGAGTFYHGVLSRCADKSLTAVE